MNDQPTHNVSEQKKKNKFYKTYKNKLLLASKQSSH